MDILKVAMGHVLKWEGGRADHKSDPGGLTKYGISLKWAGSVHLDLDRDGKTTKADIELVTPEIAAQLYIDHFWMPAKCSILPPSIAIAQFDAAVNLGVPRAIRMFQKGLRAGVRSNIAADGVFGPVTAGALLAMQQNNTTEHVLKEMLARRGEWYASLDTLDDTFGLGWMRRLIDVTFLTNGILLGEQHD